MAMRPIKQNYRLFTTIGSLLLAVVVLMDVVTPEVEYHPAMLLALVLVGSVFLVVDLELYRRNKPEAKGDQFMLRFDLSGFR